MLKKRLFGMTTLIIGVMLVFSLIGCDDGNGNGGGNTETIITGTSQLDGSTITFSFPDDEDMDGLTATLDGNTITISGREDWGEFLNGTYTRSGSGSGLSGSFTRTIPGEGIITFTFSGNDVTVVFLQFDGGGSGGGLTNGSMTVSNIPQEYVGGSYRLYASGGLPGGGNGSGRVWSGAAQGNTMTPTPITSTTVVLPLNWQRGTTGNETLAVWIYITTDTSINIQSSGVPNNIIGSQQLTLTFSGRSASVNWSGGGGNPPLKVTGAQVYTLSGTTFTEYAGSGSEQEVTGWITDGPSEGSSLGKIGTISSDGKLTLELPSSIADNKLFELPQGYGDGKFAMARVLFGHGEKLELYNSSDVNKIVIFTYFPQNATANGMSVKNGWNYIETE